MAPRTHVSGQLFEAVDIWQDLFRPLARYRQLAGAEAHSKLDRPASCWSLTGSLNRRYHVACRRCRNGITRRTRGMGIRPFGGPVVSHRSGPDEYKGLEEKAFRPWMVEREGLEPSTPALRARFLAQGNL